MKLVVDLTGQTIFGVKVLRFAGQNKNGQSKWECICTCGRNVIKLAGNLKRGSNTCVKCSYTGSRKRNTNNKRKRHIDKSGLPCEVCGAPSFPDSGLVTKDSKYARLCRSDYMEIY